MATRLFSFVQAEYPWALGPTDGRYVIRAEAEAEVADAGAGSSAAAHPEHIVVLGTLGAPQRRMLSRRRRSRPADPDASPVATARATVIDASPFAEESEARAWLTGVDADQTVTDALAVLNRVLFAHRIASADPSVHELTAAQALILRVGWGEGEQVATGSWRDARELVLRAPRRRRTMALRPQERLAVLLGGRGAALAGEEHTLRARLDFDQGRLRHAALELGAAYATALPELRAEGRADLRERLAELDELRSGVQEAARRAADPANAPPLDGEVLEHALRRLEAALRARTAAGFQHS